MTHPPVVAAIVTSTAGILISQRADQHPPWAFIGGTIEPDETPADAAIREVKEETGLDITTTGTIGNRTHPATGHHLTYIACTPTTNNQEPETLTQIRWATLTETINLMPDLYPPVLTHLTREQS